MRKGVIADEFVGAMARASTACRTAPVLVVRDDRFVPETAPARLLRLVETWLASGLVRNFICTIKFQGETDHETARAFAAIPGARVLHLYHNKHELTWMRIEE